MSSANNIFNSTARDSALELLRREQGVAIDLGSSTVAVVSTSGTEAELHIIAKPISDEGVKSAYVHRTKFRYTKIDLNQILPTDLAYDGEFPLNFERLVQFLRFSYGFLLEPGELRMDDGSTTVYPPLVAGSVIDKLNPQGDLMFKITANSGRWIEGGMLRLKRLPYDG